jgi:hypothetical protein
MKRLIAFDLDGTLAPSKSPLPERMAELIGMLLEEYHVCIISGGNFTQFEKQLLSNLKLENKQYARLHLMPTCGTKYYRYNIKKESWYRIYSEDIPEKDKQRIKRAFMEALDRLNYHEKKVYGELIDDRGSQLTLSVLGQDIVDVLGEKGVELKESWDPENKKKEKIREFVASKITDYEIKVGGLTSVDVTKTGVDKAYGMAKLMNELRIDEKDILFIGDRLKEGGNDYPVKAMGIDCIEIIDWHQTAIAINAILHVS